MPDASSDPRIAFERIRSLYRGVPPAFVAAMTVSLYLVGTSWNHAPHATALGWLAVMLGLQSLRFAAYFEYRREPPDISRTAHWARRYTVFIVLTGGFTWGVSPFLFMEPGDPISHAMVMMGMYGLGAGVVPGLAYHLPALQAFLLLVFLPLVVRLATLGGVEYWVLAAATLLFMGVLIGFGRNTARTIEEALRVRFENLDLLETVRREKDAADDARSRAESANRAKSQFFAAASHDLRQPLHALGLYSAALRETATDTQQHIVRQVEGSIEALESLFNELLDISKLDAGVVVPRLAHIPLQPLFDEMHAQFAGPAREKGLELRIRATSAVVHGDRTLLARILANLLSNAIRYTHTGGVLLGARAAAGRVRLEVWDTGIGIPADQHGRIFEEFYQLDNPERDRRKGLGLGLATVSRLATLLGLPLSLASRPGRGSVFRIDLPAGDAARVEKPVAAPVLQDALAGRCIAVVDDELSIRDSMQTLLRQWRCEAVCAANADGILSQLSGRRPDLILADYRLAGGQTGVDVIRRLHEAFGNDIPALLITGDTAPERIRETRIAGWQVIHKPVRPIQLRAACNHLLSA